MAYYLVRANIEHEDVADLENRLRDGSFIDMQPFGKALTKGLAGMRRLPDGRVAWEEEDYCTPPLRMEREAVLDTYFTDLNVERVEKDDAWSRLQDLPRVFEDLA